MATGNRTDGASSWRFPENTVTFLRDLAANNNRGWFNDNKPLYERAIKEPATEFGALLSDHFESLTGRPHKPRVFRIHRDVRFAKDKTPFNAHLHISLTPDGIKPAPAWMFGLEPDRLVFGAGLMGCDKSGLDAFRTRIAGSDGKRLQRLCSAPM